MALDSNTLNQLWQQVRQQAEFMASQQLPAIRPIAMEEADTFSRQPTPKDEWELMERQSACGHMIVMWNVTS